MKTNISSRLNPCQSVGISNWQPDTETTRRPSITGWFLLIVMTLLLVVPLAAFSKGPGGGGGGGNNGGSSVVSHDQVDYGDIFGDLIHIFRDEVTGQPIFAQRWVEMPAELPGYGWGYCAIVYTDLVQDEDENPTRIPFVPYSCDLDPGALTDDPDLIAEMIVEVDYFGRLNAARTRENNLRMHFDEVISNIKQATTLKLGPAGRLMMQFCDEECVWATVDSPMESLGLYTRLMRYGHLATDPLEEDLFWHGDPALFDGAVPDYPTHPALTSEDFDKFRDAGLEHLLPVGCDNGEGLCAAPESVESDDFDSAAIFLGAAASKTGWVTVDLLQYLNRFLRISVATGDPNGPQIPPSSYAPVDSLPALYEDCWSSDKDPTYNGEEVAEVASVIEGEDPPPVDDLVYDSVCIVCSADGFGDNHDDACPENEPVNYELFFGIQERFMNFEKSAYTRGIRPNAEDTLIMPYDADLMFLEGAFSKPQTVDLLEWIEIPNPLEWTGTDFDYRSNIANFVIGANDAARSIEFIHNYEIPEDLYCKYLGEDDPLREFFECPTDE